MSNACSFRLKRAVRSTLDRGGMFCFWVERMAHEIHPPCIHNKSCILDICGGVSRKRGCIIWILLGRSMYRTFDDSIHCSPNFCRNIQSVRLFQCFANWWWVESSIAQVDSELVWYGMMEPWAFHSRWQKQPFDRWICILLTFSSLAKSSDDIQTEAHAKLKGQEKHQPNWNNTWSLTWKGMSISWISAWKLWVAQVTWYYIIFYPLFRVSHRRPVLKGFLTSGCTSNRCSLELCWSSRAENFSLDAFQKKWVESWNPETHLQEIIYNILKG